MASLRGIACVSLVVGAALFASAPVLADTPGTLAAGDYRSTSNDAGFFFFSPADGTFVGIDVLDKISTTRLQGGAQSTSSEETTVNLQISGPQFAFACYRIS